MAKGVVYDKSMEFAIRIVNLYKHLVTDRQEHVMSKQLLRCGTSIGANLSESEYAISKKDFLAKINISLKECNETQYWLQLLQHTGFLKNNEYESINNDCIELLKLLISISKTTASSLNTEH